MQFWKLSHINLIAIFWRLQSKREAIRVEDLYQVCIWVHSNRLPWAWCLWPSGTSDWWCVMHTNFSGARECYWIWETVEERYFVLVLAEWLSRAISGRFPSVYLEALQQPLLSVTPDLFALVSRHGGHDDFLSLKVLGQRTPKGKQQEGHDSETDWEVWTSARVDVSWGPAATTHFLWRSLLVECRELLGKIFQVKILFTSLTRCNAAF